MQGKKWTPKYDTEQFTQDSMLKQTESYVLNPLKKIKSNQILMEYISECEVQIK